MINTWLLLAAHFALAVASAFHALLYKRDPRAALGWIAVSFAYPFLGPVLYYLLGINRIRTRAHKIKGEPVRRLKIGHEGPVLFKTFDKDKQLPVLSDHPDYAALVRSSAAVTRRNMVGDNQLQAFFTGEEAYAAMLEAIEQASQSICVATYIFETNRIGMTFIDALVAAQHRGVDVCVLLDGFGEWYSLPRAGSLLKAEGVTVARFIPPRILPPSIHVNLRNHRKLLVVDGISGFTGGMNIGDRHLRRQSPPRDGTTDIHFRIEGPVVEQMQAVFDEDWLFAAGQQRRAPEQKPGQAGSAICRVVTDGPDEDLGKLSMIITGAVALARKRVAIMTPYFLPPPELINALQAASLRGVDVSIILPQKSNIPITHWATRHMLWELLQFGVHVYYQPPPFAHSKLFLIDEAYAHIGSANLDPRSLRLNFELVVEVIEPGFVKTLADHFERIRALSREESLAGVDGRWLPAKIRDGTARLFSPYL